MDVPSGREEQDEIETDGDTTATERVVSCHETRPGRRVFTERGNTDGWIATDVVVDLVR